MKNNLLDEQYISNLPQAIVQNLQWQSQYIVSLICERIRDIGQLSPSDAHRLSAAYYAGADIKKINREIARITGLNISEIDKIYKETGEENAAFAKTLYDFRNVPYVPYAENKKMQSIIRAAAETTKDEYINLSRTAGFVSRDGTPRTIRQQYMNAIDRAISNVATGSTDYQSEMQATIKEMANSGYRTISYENGYSRRMDTAVRQNILTGIKDITQQIQRQVGQELGADGYEISYHANPRPSHEVMGGTQYTKEQFVAQGIDKLLADYNCRHIAFDIIVGVTEPNFSREELAEMKARDSEPREWQGEPISGYKATQKQRIYEAKIRKLKDEAMAFSHTGDTLRQMQAQRKINEMSAEYARFSKAVGLPVKDNRVAVAGFRGVRTEGLDNRRNNDIISNIKSTKAVPKNSNVSLVPRKIDITKLSFDDKHINREREHNVTEKDAISFIKNAKISATVWNGKYERYYSTDGAAYVDVSANSIRTAYSSEQYDDKTILLMEVLNENGK